MGSRTSTSDITDLSASADRSGSCEISIPSAGAWASCRCSQRSLPLVMGTGGLGSTSSGLKNFLGGLALGNAKVGCGTTSEPWLLTRQGVSWCPGCPAGQRQCVLRGWNCTSGSRKFQDTDSFTPKPFSVDLDFMQVQFSGRCGVLLIPIIFYGSFYIISLCFNIRNVHNEQELGRVTLGYNVLSDTSKSLLINSCVHSQVIQLVNFSAYILLQQAQ